MHHCHLHTPTLVVARKDDQMLFFNWNQFSHWLVKDFATQATRERGINRRSRDHNQNIGWMFQSSLLRNTWLSVGLEVQCIIQGLISVLELGLSSINLKGMMSVFLPLERSEPTTWEVTSARVQKHNLSTMLSKRADNDSFSNSKALALNSDRSICSFNASISACCLLMCRKNLSYSLSTYTSLAQLLSTIASAYTLTSARSFFI